VFYAFLYPALSFARWHGQTAPKQALERKGCVRNFSQTAGALAAAFSLEIEFRM
jgi:hypothetical protein